MASQTDCVLLDSANMTVRDLIFCVDRHCERFDGRDVERVELKQVPIRILHTIDTSGVRKVENEENWD
jgi:hypothetical protein